MRQKIATVLLFVASALILMGCLTFPLYQKGEEIINVDGYDGWIRTPKNAAPGNPWLWRARFPTYHSEIDAAFLKAGYHIVYLNTENELGSPRAMKSWKKTYDLLVPKYKLNPKAGLYGVSRGGLFIHNFAATYPECTAFVMGDAPVCDYTSWPGVGNGVLVPEHWTMLKEAYGFTSDEEAINSPLNPIKHAKKLAENKIPIYHIVCPDDEIVPPTKNSHAFAAAFRAAGGSITIEETRLNARLQGHHFDIPDIPKLVLWANNHTALPDLDATTMQQWETHTNNLASAFYKFETEGKGSVAFLGGSITYNPGWRNATMQMLQERFPNCEFTFTMAGIPSFDSRAHAFRRSSDLPEGVDLLVYEAAVNDNQIEDPDQIDIAAESVIRGALLENPDLSILWLHFYMPAFDSAFAKEEESKTTASHSKIASHYGISQINLAREVYDRLQEDQFSWENDFVDLHPSAFGQTIYANAIRKIFNKVDYTTKPESQALPTQLSPNLWINGKIVATDTLKADTLTLNGFRQTANWKASLPIETRDGYKNCPVLEGSKVGDSFTLKFTGNTFGFMAISGPHSPILEYQLDGANWKEINTQTPWSEYLYLPYPFILENYIGEGEHEITIRIKAPAVGKTKIDSVIRYIYTNVAP